jgi:sec-independent protein translocase protein TatC
LGVLKAKWLCDHRRAAIVFAFILAAIITPTFDPINQSLAALPLIGLYEMSIWLTKLVHRRKPSVAKTASSATV